MNNTEGEGPILDIKGAAQRLWYTASGLYQLIDRSLFEKGRVSNYARMAFNTCAKDPNSFKELPWQQDDKFHLKWLYEFDLVCCTLDGISKCTDSYGDGDNLWLFVSKEQTTELWLLGFPPDGHSKYEGVNIATNMDKPQPVGTVGVSRVELYPAEMVPVKDFLKNMQKPENIKEFGSIKAITIFRYSPNADNIPSGGIKKLKLQQVEIDSRF